MKRMPRPTLCQRISALCEVCPAGKESIDYERKLRKISRKHLKKKKFHAIMCFRGILNSLLAANLRARDQKEVKSHEQV